MEIIRDLGLKLLIILLPMLANEFSLTIVPACADLIHTILSTFRNSQFEEECKSLCLQSINSSLAINYINHECVERFCSSLLLLTQEKRKFKQLISDFVKLCSNCMSADDFQAVLL
jgi:hypothetical protein